LTIKAERGLMKDSQWRKSREKRKLSKRNEKRRIYSYVRGRKMLQAVSWKTERGFGSNSEERVSYFDEEGFRLEKEKRSFRELVQRLHSATGAKEREHEKYVQVD